MTAEAPAAALSDVDDAEIIPDIDQPWLPSIATVETGLPAAAVALGVGVIGWMVNTGRGPLEASIIGVFSAVLIILAVIDIKTHRLPDAIVLPMYPVLLLIVAAGTAAGALTLRQSLTALASMAGAFIILWLIAVFTGGLGFGDVKLGGLLGLVCGLQDGYAAALGALLLPMIVGGFAALPLLLLGRRKQELAFGPYLVAGALLVLLLPDVLVPISQGSLMR